MRGATLLLALGLAAAPPPDLMEQAGTLRAGGKLAEALALYAQITAAQPANTEAWFYRGTLAYELNRHAEAVPALARVVQAQPKAALAWALLGLSEYELGKLDPARQHLTLALGLGVTEENGLRDAASYHLAILRNKAGEFEFANNLLTQFARAGQDTPPVIEATGIAALRLPLLPAEVPAADLPLVLQMGRAVWHANARHVAQAQAELELLARRYPDRPNVHYQLGLFLTGAGNERGLHELAEELKISPGHVPARVQIAVERLARGEADQAAPYSAAALKLAPTFWVAKLIHGRVLLAQAKPQQALPLLQQAAKAAPDSPEAHFHLAQAYLRTGDKLRARQSQAEFKRLNALRGQ